MPQKIYIQLREKLIINLNFGKIIMKNNKDRMLTKTSFSSHSVLFFMSHPVLTMLASSENVDNAATMSNLIRCTQTTLLIPNVVAYTKD